VEDEVHEEVGREGIGQVGVVVEVGSGVSAEPEVGGGAAGLGEDAASGAEVQECGMNGFSALFELPDEMLSDGVVVERSGPDAAGLAVGILVADCEEPGNELIEATRAGGGSGVRVGMGCGSPDFKSV
jgi:hypothetical protein